MNRQKHIVTYKNIKTTPHISSMSARKNGQAIHQIAKNKEKIMHTRSCLDIWVINCFIRISIAREANTIKMRIGINKEPGTISSADANESEKTSMKGLNNPHTSENARVKSLILVLP
jgi:hypothetical protein